MRSEMSKRFFTLSAVLSGLLFGLVSPAAAAEVNPNGFPSGEHYNLNIHGKKSDYSCSSETQLDMYGEPVYGKSVFVPEYGDAGIYIESGKGKKAAAVTELQVTDPCGGFDGDGAVLQLPKNASGYRVYARALGKPTDEPSMTLSSNLSMVQDEFGNDLLYLGLVTDNGFETPYETLTRKKGHSKAVDISGMFQWSGSVCNLSEPTEGYSSTETFCCADTDLDGMLDECVEPTVDAFTGLASCELGYAEQTVYCQDFESEWVFNIADFVQYLWNSSNDGMKLLQVRFYPN